MSDDSDLVDKISDLVCDAVPDPPRLPDYNFENQHLNGDHENKKNNKEPSNNSSDVNDNDNDDDTRETSNSTSRPSRTSADPKPKKSRKSPKFKLPSNATVIVNSSNVKVGPSFKHYYYLNNIQHNNSTPANGYDSHSTTTEQESRTMLPHVKNLSTSKLVISKEDMFVVKTHIGNNWKKVAKQIDYSKGQIEQFLKKYEHEGIDEVMYQILLDWKQCYTKNATLGQLISAIWLAEEYECAEILAATHSNNQTS